MRQRICVCGHSSERHAPDCDVCGYHVCATFEAAIAVVASLTGREQR